MREKREVEMFCASLYHRNKSKSVSRPRPYTLIGRTIRICLIVAHWICLSYSGYAQVDHIQLVTGGSISGQIVEEVLGEYVRVQNEAYRLLRVPEEDIAVIQRPLAIEGFWEVVHLRKGGTIQGFLVEYEWGKYVKLEDSRRNVFGYTWDEILRIVKKPVPDDPILYNRSSLLMRRTRQHKRAESREVYKGQGLFFIEGGGLVATTDELSYYPGVFGHAILSVFVSEDLSLGIGGGVEFIQYASDYGEMGQYGLIDMRLYFPQQGWTPYVGLMAGLDWFRSGAFGNPGIGVRKKVFRRFWLNGNIGVKLQQIGNNTISDVLEPGYMQMLQVKIVID